MAEQKKSFSSLVFIFLLTLVPKHTHSHRNAFIYRNRRAHTNAVEVQIQLKWRHATFRIYVHENIDKMAQRIFHEHTETFEKFCIFFLCFDDDCEVRSVRGPDFQHRKSSTYFNALTANITMKYAIYKVWHRSVQRSEKIANRTKRNGMEWNGMERRILRIKFFETLRKYTAHK